MSFKITRYTKCVHCDSAYFNRTTVCPHCKGTGYCDVEFIVHEDQVCHTCGGSGMTTYRNQPWDETIPYKQKEGERIPTIDTEDHTYTTKCRDCFGTGKRYVPTVKQ